MSDTATNLWDRTISDSITGQSKSTNTLANGASPTSEAGRMIDNQLMVSAAPRTAMRTSFNQIDRDTVYVTRPIWSKDYLPVMELTPINVVEKPIVVDQYYILPNPYLNVAYVAPTEVSLSSFSLVLRRSVLPNRGLAITGGSASFSISTYGAYNLKAYTMLRKNWDVALRKTYVGERLWSYQPEQRKGLSVSVELPPGIAASEPLILSSPLAGVCDITIELTEIGALTWKAALEQGVGSTLAGIFHVSTHSLAVDGVDMRFDRKQLDTTIGRLLANRSAADIRYIDPQQTVQGKLVIVTNDLVERMTVSMQPNQGLAPESQTFGPEGGQVEVSISTQDVASVVIDWTAEVAFIAPGWPPIQASGRMNSANGWTDMIKPDSWIVNYLLMAIPVDNQGKVQAINAAGTTTQLQGVLNFTAPYVTNGLLNSSFAAEYLLPINIALPRYPGQPFGDVVLTIFATRDGVGGMKSRKLNADEVNLVALIYPDARVEIRSSLDALSELSAASEILGLMGAL